MDKDSIYWETVNVAASLLEKSKLLNTSKLEVPAKKLAAKAAILLMVVVREQKDIVFDEELKGLLETFNNTKDPFERLEILKSIKEPK